MSLCHPLSHVFRLRLNNIFRPGGKVFYGWWIVAACAACSGWPLTWMHSYGGYALKLQADFGWSMSVLSLAFALTRLESGLLGPFQGWLVDRYGPRRILIIGTLIFAVGFFIFQFGGVHYHLLRRLHSDRSRV